MNHEDIIKNLFTDKYTHDEKVESMAKLEIENPPLLDELIKKHQHWFWSKNPITTLGSHHNKFAGYEIHIMSFVLIKSLNEYQRNKNYHPSIDFSLTNELKHLLR